MNTVKRTYFVSAISTLLGVAFLILILSIGAAWDNRAPVRQIRVSADELTLSLSTDTAKRAEARKAIDEALMNSDEKYAAQRVVAYILIAAGVFGLIVGFIMNGAQSQKSDATAEPDKPTP